MNKVIFPLLDNKAPAVPEGTDWRNYQGEVITPLVGVLVPEGVIVLDLARSKGVTFIVILTQESVAKVIL